MRKFKTIVSTASAFALLAGCAVQPVGPTVRVLPAAYKPFDVFQRDQYDCKNYATEQTAGEADQANNRAVGAAAIGAGLGLALGAATGRGRNATEGAAFGAAAGTAVGANESQREGYSLQRQYDIAYSQCMYAKGNQVPGYQSQDRPPPPPPRGQRAPDRDQGGPD